MSKGLNEEPSQLEQMRVLLSAKFKEEFNKDWQEHKKAWSISSPPEWVDRAFRSLATFVGVPDAKMFFELGEGEEHYGEANAFLKEIHLRLGPHWFEEGNRPGILNLLAHELVHIRYYPIKHSKEFEDLVFTTAENFADTHPLEAEILEWT